MLSAEFPVWFYLLDLLFVQSIVKFFPWAVSILSLWRCRITWWCGSVFTITFFAIHRIRCYSIPVFQYHIIESLTSCIRISTSCEAVRWLISQIERGNDDVADSDGLMDLILALYHIWYFFGSVSKSRQLFQLNVNLPFGFGFISSLLPPWRQRDNQTTQWNNNDIFFSFLDFTRFGSEIGNMENTSDLLLRYARNWIIIYSNSERLPFSEFHPAVHLPLNFNYNFSLFSKKA
jgi:hypothetical protein